MAIARCGRRLGVLLAVYAVLVGCGSDVVTPPILDATDSVNEPPDSVAGDASPDTFSVDVDADGAVSADSDDAQGLPVGDTFAPPTCAPDLPCVLASPSACTEGLCSVHGECLPQAIPGCCVSDSDCQGIPVSSACELLRCVASTCRVERHPYCCEDDDACDDGLGCSDDVCDPTVNRCQHCPWTCACGPATATAHYGFDDGLEPQTAGFSVSDLQPQDSVTWRLSGARWVTPPASLYLGGDRCDTYYSGALTGSCEPVDPFQQDASRVSIDLRTPTLDLPADAPQLVASLFVRTDVEDSLTGDGLADRLSLWFEPLDGSGPEWQLVADLAVVRDTDVHFPGGWRQVVVDLAPWRDVLGRLRLSFDTLDGNDNLGAGVNIDEFRVTHACEGGGCCDNDSDCGPSDDPCRARRCRVLRDSTTRVCIDEPTVPGTRCQTCSDDADCEDANPCSSDSCTEGICRNEVFCCFRRVLADYDMESALTGWVLDGAATTWQRTETRAHGGLSSLWFGDPATGTYAESGRSRGSAASPLLMPPVLAASTDKVELAFSVWLETEWTGADYINPAGLDRLYVDLVLEDGETRELWNSDALAGSTDGLWRDVVVGVDDLPMTPFRLAWRFDSLDASNNDFEGPYIDSIELRTACPTVP